MRHQIVRGSIGSFGIKVAHMALIFLVEVILARALKPEGYGIYAYIYALTAMIAIPAQLGLPQLVVRETAKAQANEQWGLMRGLWRWSTISVWVFSAALMLATLSIVWFLGERISELERLTLIFGLLLIPLIALGNLRSAALRGLHRVVIGQLPENIIRPGLLILFLLIMSFHSPNQSLDPSSAMGLHALAAAIAFGVGAWLLWHSRPIALSTRPTAIYQAKDWISAALPLALISGLQVINRHIDVLMLGLFRSSEEVGIYKVVANCAFLATFGFLVINSVVAPYFARLYAQGNKKQLQQIVTQSARIIFALAFLAVFMFISFGETILSLIFGTNYATGHNALAILALGQLVNASMGPVSLLLNMTGHERNTMRGIAIASGANIILNLILIPPFGVNGAAAATAITLTIWNVLLWWSVRKHLGIESMAFKWNPKQRS